MHNCDCGKEFKSKQGLAGHKAHCGKDHLEKCPICEALIIRCNFARHLKGHEKDSDCPTCGLVVYGRNKFCNHSCAARFNNKGVRRYGEIPGNCLCCGKQLRESLGTYCSRKCHRRYEWETRKKEYECSGSFPNSQQARRYLLEKNGNVCEICDIDIWQGKPVPLVADHINGNPEDNSITNFRMICCNCDAQLPTYKAKNKGNGRAARRKRYKDGKSY